MFEDVNEFVTTNVDFEGEIWDAFEFDVRWRRNLRVDRETEEIKSVSQFLDLDTAITFFDRLRLSYRGRYNLEDSENVEDTFGITYNGQCWSILGNFTQQLIGDEHDRGFQILLELKHIGKLLDLKG